MSERKVLTKYYPPDFDPSALKRQRGPKQVGPKVSTVRLMAPFSMRCTSCGEYVYKGRKFNARKESPESEKYLGIQIHRFHIKCTRCSAEIIFRTDPKNQEYAMVKGAKRNTEPWRRGLEQDAEETDEQRLDRLEQEEAEMDRMEELEAKTVDAKREMDVADALDEIRTRNARLERADRDGLEVTVARPEDDEEARQEAEDRAAARAAFLYREVEDLTMEKWEGPVEETPESGETTLRPVQQKKKKSKEESLTERWAKHGLKVPKILLEAARAEDSMAKAGGPDKPTVKAMAKAGGPDKPTVKAMAKAGGPTVTAPAEAKSSTAKARVRLCVDYDSD